MTNTQNMGDYFAELEAQQLAQARAEIAAEQADPAHHARVLARMAEREAQPDAPAKPVSPCGSCGQETDEEDLDDGECPDCVAERDAE